MGRCSKATSGTEDDSEAELDGDVVVESAIKSVSNRDLASKKSREQVRQAC
jgi:hypothetical protein